MSTFWCCCSQAMGSLVFWYLYLYPGIGLAPSPVWNDHWMFFFFPARLYQKVNNCLARLSNNHWIFVQQIHPFMNCCWAKTGRYWISCKIILLSYYCIKLQQKISEEPFKWWFNLQSKRFGQFTLNYCAGRLSASWS